MTERIDRTRIYKSHHYNRGLDFIDKHDPDKYVVYVNEEDDVIILKKKVADFQFETVGKIYVRNNFDGYETIVKHLTQYIEERKNV